MILNTEESNSRLSSTDNLINRLNLKVDKKTPPEIIPEIIPQVSELVEGLDDKLAVSNMKRVAVRIAGKSLAVLENRIPEVASPKQLSAIARDMSAIVSNAEGADRKRIEAAQIVIWQPTIISADQFNQVTALE